MFVGPDGKRTCHRHNDKYESYCARKTIHVRNTCTGIFMAALLY